MNTNAFIFQKKIFETNTYGTYTPLVVDLFKPGLSKETPLNISSKKGEDSFFATFRAKAYKKWEGMNFPMWSSLRIPEIDFQSIIYYSSVIDPIVDLSEKEKNYSKVLSIFETLGISILKEESKASMAIDAVFDSSSVLTTYQEYLAKEGVIFCSIGSAISFYPKLVKKYLGYVVPSGDNYFSALNSAVFTDGSFCYVPKEVQCPLELSTYFRLNNPDSGQFERTLIVAEKNSKLSYLEGCTAPQHKKNQLHAAVVELIAFEKAKIKYSTIQNWYPGNNEGNGGVYNFVTKRALCIGADSEVSWVQIEKGSAITWKYPSCVLLGKRSRGEFYSAAFTCDFQQADTGTKMVHLGSNSQSKIVSKGISYGHSSNTYRGLVKVGSSALHSRNYSQCDAFLLGSGSTSSTHPYIDVSNATSLVEHEASVSQLNQDQLIYLQQRGMSFDQALALILGGFCREVFANLPLEFASEATELLSINIEQ